MTIAEFVALVQRRLRDDVGRQWTTEYVTDAVNAAFSALCHVAPQAYTEHRDLSMIIGTEQQTDPDLHQIVHFLHNVCPTTGQAKRAIIKADLSIMDKVAPQWRQDAPRGHVIHYLSNAVDESKFYVWPPVGSTQTNTTAPTVVADPGPLNPPTVEQEDIDAYNAYLVEQAAYDALPTDQLIRGVFTKTPCIYTGSLTDPVVPTDPGPANVADNILTLNAFYYTENGTNTIALEFTDATALTGFGALTVDGESVLLIFQNGPDAWTGPNNNLGAIPDDVFPAGTVAAAAGGALPGAGSMGIALEGFAFNTYVDSLDDIVGAGNNDAWPTSATTMLTNQNDGSDRIDIDDNDFTPVTNQDVIDYNAALAQYNIDLAAYNAATSGKLQLTDDIPFDKAHFLPLQEFSLYYGHVRDDEQTANSGRAMQHWQNFWQLLNKREDAEIFVKTAEDDAE